jgi:hypothetical protein
MIRSEVSQLVRLGPFPSSRAVDPDLIQRQEYLLMTIEPPVSDAEARKLIKLFGPDDYFGLAWKLLHLIEKAPNWPLEDCLSDTSNEWIAMLKDRSERKKELYD